MNRKFDKDKIKLAAIDLDGTILTKSFVTDEVKAAVTRLAESGVETVVATGRHLFQLPPSVMEISSFQNGIGSNGALVGNMRDRITFSFDGFDLDTAVNFLHWLPTITKAFHMAFQDGTGYLMKEDYDRLLALQPSDAEREKSSREYRRVYTISDDLDYVSQTMKPVAKFGFRMDNPEDIPTAMNAVREKFGFEAALTDYQTIEVTKAGVTKGSGLAHICDHYGLKPENVIVFGDSGNDIPMMKIAGYAVAMGNAMPDVKLMADEVTGTLAEDGVVTAINRLFDL